MNIMNKKAMWSMLRNLILVIVVLIVLIIIIMKIKDKNLEGLDFISNLLKFG